MKRKILTKDIDCPNCSAKAGENCYLQLSSEEQSRRPRDGYKIDENRVHMDRWHEVDMVPKFCKWHGQGLEETIETNEEIIAKCKIGCSWVASS